MHFFHFFTFCLFFFPRLFPTFNFHFSFSTSLSLHSSNNTFWNKFWYYVPARCSLLISIFSATCISVVPSNNLLSHRKWCYILGNDDAHKYILQLYRLQKIDHPRWSTLMMPSIRDSSVASTLSVSSIVQPSSRPSHVLVVGPTSRFILLVPQEEPRTITTLQRSYLLQEAFFTLRGVIYCNKHLFPNELVSCAVASVHIP